MYSQLCVIIAGTIASIPCTAQGIIAASETERQATRIWGETPTPKTQHGKADAPDSACGTSFLRHAGSL